jgi:HlyD family secretion protein
MAVAIIAAATAGYFLWNNPANNITYRTEKISRGDVVVQVRATGTINPVRTVQVGSQVSGTLSKILVDFNSVVKEGQIIALIDSTFLYASVKEAEANLERNQAQVNETKRSLTRAQELFRKNLISQAELDAAQTAHEQAIAQLKQARAALDRARVNLRFSVIRAPIDGVVISRDVDVGQTVAASLQAPQLFVIANDLRQMQVEASVDEADIGQIREGQMVTFTVDAYPDQEFRGTVRQVRLAPVTVQNVVTYTVIIEVPNPELKLRPGMTATVSVLIDKREDVLRIPSLALRFQPPSSIAEKFSARLRESQDTGGEQTAEVQRQSSQGRQRGGREGGSNGGFRSDGRRMRDGSKRGSALDPPKQFATVWLLESGKSLKPVRVQLGLNDNRFVEVNGGDLQGGEEVVLGIIDGERGTTSVQQQTNPFAPRMPGGGGRSRF